MNWDNSTDTEVERYYIYRRASEATEWNFAHSVAESQGTDQLPRIGLWEYSVTAVDSVGPIMPVESEHTEEIVVLWGQQPPTHLRANGNFDDRVRLTWLAPGTIPETELFYDDGTSENAVGLNSAGWFFTKYSTSEGSATITRIKMFVYETTNEGDQAQVGVFEDVDGVPAATPIAVVDIVSSCAI